VAISSLYLPVYVLCPIFTLTGQVMLCYDILPVFLILFYIQLALYPWALSLRIKCLWHESNTPPSSAKAENACSYTSAQYSFVVWCLIKQYVMMYLNTGTALPLPKVLHTL